MDHSSHNTPPHDDPPELDIEFGQVEESKPQTLRRPNQDARFAVAAVGAPHESDLPIFVDADVMIDMETHAVSDRSIELGGVLLGGQYLDEEGRPFVVIEECIRAQHYEATKGSFKFTHETWEQITRTREQFPDDLQMVGWYHTHPGWGVFLSGMDLFICDHFFNRPLDVALVIDPCQDERGMFQWTEDRTVRQTLGFYLTANRFRAHELNAYAARLRKEPDMMRGQAPYPPPAPTDPWSDPRTVAMFSGLGLMLLMQFVLVALVAWKVVSPASPPAETEAEKLDRSALVAQRRVLDDVVAQLATEGGDSVVNRLTETEQQLTAAEAALRGQDALRSENERKLRSMERELKSMQKKMERSNKLLDDAKQANLSLKDQLKEAGVEVAEGGWRMWHYALAVVGALGIAGGAAALLRRGGPDEQDFASQEEPV